jgi:hypothetical protein
MTSQVGRPLRPPDGIAWVDKIAIAFDQRERQQAQQPDLMQALMAMQGQQTKILALLTQILQAKAGKEGPKDDQGSEP